MKVRTKLVLACFFLSILPLAGIVLYSYQSSRKALESAYHNEAARMTRQMDHRLAAIRGDLQQRLAEVSELPLQTLPNGAPGSERIVVSDVLRALGDSARLVDSLELQPVTPPAPPQPAASLSAAHHASGERIIVRHAPAAVPDGRTSSPPNGRNTLRELVTAAERADDSDDGADDAQDDAQEPPEPIVIDIPSMPMIPRVTMTEEPP